MKNVQNNVFQDEKYLLKFHTGSGVVTGGGRDDAKKIHSPVIKSVPLPPTFSTSYQMFLLQNHFILLLFLTLSNICENIHILQL